MDEMFEQQEQQPIVENKKESKNKYLVLTIVVCLLISTLSSILTALYVINKTNNKTVFYQAVESEQQTVVNVNDFSTIIPNIEDSVVEVYTEKVTYNSFWGNYVNEGAGSGVILSEDGYIITNNHVIDGATSINVSLHNGQKYEATLVGTDVKTDIAVIKIEETNLKPVVLGDSDDLKVGQWALAIGNPLGTLGGTLTIGVVSALSREIVVENVPMTLLQIDAAISPGNSGGGLFNTSGSLIAIVNAKSTAESTEGIGFAIPVNVAKEVAVELIEQGYVTGRAMLGIQCISIDTVQKAWNYNFNRYGVLVSELVSDNAKASDLKTGDLIIGINDQEVSSLTTLQTILYSYNANDQVILKVLRNNEIINVEFTLSQKK